LPLLQLAGFDGQPLLRVIVAWLLAGIVLGLALISLEPLRRGALAATVGLVLLLLASDASYALARNLRFSAVLRDRAPGLGPWLEGALLGVGSAVPRLWRAEAGSRARRATGLLRPPIRTGLRAVGAHRSG
jgi:hypothetical protein